MEDRKEADKKCIYQCLYVKPEKARCYTCVNYDLECPSYIPMVESQLERITRITKQLNIRIPL